MLSMRFYDIIRRLTFIFPYKHILLELSDFGVIAGGSIVFALNKFVPLDSVGDIDVFVNSKENYDKCVTLLQTYFAPHFETIVYDDVHYNFAVLSVNISNKHKLQIIYHEYETPVDIIDSFDLDYVQCAIHNGNIYQTDRCVRSHKHRQIFEFSDIRFRNGRFRKAVDKGFKCPIVVGSCAGNDGYHYVDTTYDNIIDNKILKFHDSVYLTVRRDNWYSVDSITFIGATTTFYHRKLILKDIVLEITSCDGKTTIKSTARQFSYNFEHITYAFPNFLSTSDPVLSLLKCNDRTFSNNNILISPYKSVLDIDGFKITSHIIRALNSNALPIKVKVSKLHEVMPITDMLSFKPKFKDNKAAEIKYIYDHWINGLSMHKRNAMQAYMYYIDKGETESRAVEIAATGYIIDCYKHRHDNYDYIVRCKLHAYGLVMPIESNLIKSNPKLKTFKDLYYAFLRIY